MPRKYNYIYSRLVEGKGDIIGHIAYALYKDEKVEYISRFKKEHDGKEPDEDDLKPFNDISSSESSINKYKYIASGILQSFLENTLEETKYQIEEGLSRNHIELIRDAIKPITPPSKLKGCLYSIMQSILGAFSFSVLMCALVFVANLSTHKYTITIGGDGSTKVEQVDSVKVYSQTDSIQKKTETR